MKQLIHIIILILILTGCKGKGNTQQRVAVAEVGKSVLWLDEIPVQLLSNGADSVAAVRNYVSNWAKRKLLLMKAEENLTEEMKTEVSKQLEETRANLLIYQYQRQMMLQKMDTLISETELENYYATNEKSFTLASNIVKALFIKVPAETPGIDKIRQLARSNSQADLQQLESLCFQFAEKFDDFNEQWVTMDRIAAGIPEEIRDQESFLKRNTFYEWNDSTASVCFLSIRDYRLRSSLAPFDFVREDIKRIIWNTRRLELLQSVENGIYNDALKEEKFKVY